MRPTRTMHPTLTTRRWPNGGGGAGSGGSGSTPPAQGTKVTTRRAGICGLRKRRRTRGDRVPRLPARETGVTPRRRYLRSLPPSSGLAKVGGAGARNERRRRMRLWPRTSSGLPPPPIVLLPVRNSFSYGLRIRKTGDRSSAVYPDLALPVKAASLRRAPFRNCTRPCTGLRAAKSHRRAM